MKEKKRGGLGESLGIGGPISKSFFTCIKLIILSHLFLFLFLISIS